MTPHSPRSAAVSASFRMASSLARPRNRVNLVPRNCSPATAGLRPIRRCTSTGASMPLTEHMPRSTVSQNPRTSWKLARLMQILPASASCSIRLARCTVRPTASCSTADPMSSSPATTSPECRPIRIEGADGSAATASCIASAALQASSACPSSARGAPNAAFNPSPRLRTTIPSKRRTACAIAARTGRRRLSASSASRLAMRCVEPTISANRMVACLRSPPVLGPPDTTRSVAPHQLQNSAARELR